MPEDVLGANGPGALATHLGLDFVDLELLDQALTHSSMGSETPVGRRDNESLEFLGDAALGLAVAQWLYAQVPGRTPGEYTQMRAAVVNGDALARVATRLGIGPFIRLGKGEEVSGGRDRPALLADCMEAIIGAAFLDCGWKAARDFIGRAFEEELRDSDRSKEILDSRSRLQNYCQAERISLPEFEVVREDGPDHQKEFEVSVRLRGDVVGHGSGKSKKEAEQNAAQAALQVEGQ